jgi:hypothetical protein
MNSILRCLCCCFTSSSSWSYSTFDRNKSSEELSSIHLHEICRDDNENNEFIADEYINNDTAKLIDNTNDPILTVDCFDENSAEQLLEDKDITLGDIQLAEDDVDIQHFRKKVDIIVAKHQEKLKHILKKDDNLDEKHEFNNKINPSKNNDSVTHIHIQNLNILPASPSKLTVKTPHNHRIQPQHTTNAQSQDFYENSHKLSPTAATANPNQKSTDPLTLNPPVLPHSTSSPKLHFSQAPKSTKSPKSPKLAISIGNTNSIAPKSPEKAQQPAHSNPLMNIQSSLPSGKVSRAQLDTFLADVDWANLSYKHIFQYLLTANRVISGQTLQSYVKPTILAYNQRIKQRDLMRKNNKNAANFPQQLDAELPGEVFKFLQFFSDYLSEIRVDKQRSTLTLQFDFRGASSYTLELPTPQTYVLQSKHKTDQYLVNSLNKAVIAEVEVRKLVFNNTVELQLDKVTGEIKHVREGDVSVKKFLSFTADLHYEHKENMADYDGQNRFYLECDVMGKPMIHNNHYVPKCYDDWIVVTVMKQEVYIGLPKLQ